MEFYLPHRRRNGLIITRNLEGRWFCGPQDALDTSGKGHDGTLVGSPTWVDNGRGSELALNGTTQYCTVPDSAALTLGADFTFTCNLYLTGYSSSFAGSYGCMIVAKDNAGTAREMVLGVNATVNTYTGIYLILFANNTTYTQNTFNFALSLNTPYFIVVKRTAGVVAFSINIENTYSQANTRTVQNTAQLFEIGRRQHASYTYNLKGRLFDVRYYTECLSAADEVKIYTGSG